MYQYIIKYPCFLILATCLILLSCKKQDNWLNVKYTKSLVTPESLSDFQAMMNSTEAFNGFYSTAGLAGSDNFILADDDFLSLPEDCRNLYTWNKEIWAPGSPGIWSAPYSTIAYSNIILEGLQKLSKDGSGYDNVKGQALFHRAISLYSLAQLFCKAYTTSASTDLGLPLRLDADVSKIVARASLEDTYNQILSDAKDAASLLPEKQLYLRRPTKAAALALLAKISLAMGNYDNAYSYADACLKLNPILLDFNDLTIINPDAEYPFPQYGKYNPEVLFYAEGSQLPSVWAYSGAVQAVADDLYGAYDLNDLRRNLFYKLDNDKVKLRGTYSGNQANFCGLATNEVYLIRAECSARAGDIEPAMQDIKTLLAHRYVNGIVPDLIPGTANEALGIVLNERRKELAFTADIRWTDLKRLNLETQFQKTITRVVNGQTFTLLPNDKRYVLPIPNEEVELTKIEQNQR